MKIQIVQKKTLSILILFLTLSSCFSQVTIESFDTNNLPEISNYVNDFEDILKNKEEYQLSIKQRNIECNVKFDEIESLHKQCQELSEKLKVIDGKRVKTSKRIQELKKSGNDTESEKKAKKQNN